MSKLRRALANAGESDLVVTRPAGYQLVVYRSAVDALRFEQRERSVDDENKARAAHEAKVPVVQSPRRRRFGAPGDAVKVSLEIESVIEDTASELA